MWPTSDMDSHCIPNFLQSLRYSGSPVVSASLPRASLAIICIMQSEPFLKSAMEISFPSSARTKYLSSPFGFSAISLPLKSLESSERGCPLHFMSKDLYHPNGALTTSTPLAVIICCIRSRAPMEAFGLARLLLRWAYG